jgi:tRNA pseudouridine13 synthase
MKLNLLDTVLQGDWLQKLDTGGSFICTEPEIDQPRADRLEISPTAPMFGPRVEPSQGLPGEWEQQILQREDITLDTFRAWGKDALGTRRALRVPVSDIQTQFDSGCLRLCFTLPPGSYASVLLQELGIDFL